MKIILIGILTFSIMFAELTRKNNMVTDSDTNLIWQDNTDSATLTSTWQGAINNCEALTLGGYNDWRLPNRYELFSIIDYKKSIPAIKGEVFVNITSTYYWTSTTTAGDSNRAWYIYFRNSAIYNFDDKTATFNFRCVRDKN